jgi:23S rRNA (guanosine2251-2'-O)-methyltransferase
LRKKKSTEVARAIIYGVHPVLETLKAGKRSIDEVYLAKGAEASTGLREFLGQVSVTRKTADELRSLTRSSHHQGVAAKVGPYPYVDLSIVSSDARGNGPLLILDGVQDPVNLGTIIRSAECLGARGIIVTKDRSAPITPVTEKASSGASAHMLVARVVNLVRTIEQLKEIDFWIYAADSATGKSCYRMDLTGRIALVLGSEGKGLRRLVRETCDLAVSIPMVGSVESLNVAQAATVLLSESLRQKTGPLSSHQ